MSDLIGPEEARTIKAALSEIKSEPTPMDSGPLGCLLSLAAVVGLVVLPMVADRVGLAGTPLRATIIVLAGSLVGGLVWSVFGGAFSRGKVIGDVERAITELVEVYPNGSTDRMLALATRIIVDATVSKGPSTSRTYEPSEVAERLGPSLPFVVRVERWLMEHEGVYFVFTSSEEVGEEDA
ncbi:MAG: hypothetical protein BMS9Abin29_0163 [Gemmatimonadota bacterium]|nr:MAG: hypothetical protein BMS9Abin29_0163 [Gemmatimonadota bacterium]